MAEAMVNRGLEVTVVTRSREPMATLDPDMGAQVHRAMEGMGIDVRTSVQLREVSTGPDGRATGVVTDQGELPADVVVLGTGVEPETTLAAGAGLSLGRWGGLVTDLQMRVFDVDGVWAAGDCVESIDLVSGNRVHVALGTHANKQGRVAGINLGGGYATFPGVIGTAITKVCDVEVARTGLSEAEAEAAGYRFVSAAVDSTTRAGYFPGAQPIRVKLVAEKRTGRLLGAQIVGRDDAAKRIDVLATAIWNEMHVEEVLSLDLSYAPPFSPVWDPVLIAARKAQDAVEADFR
jgi:NADPH-dependent 2,4-dienoyl-CoA reductase/sulfur reductase-like enzyme